MKYISFKTGDGNEHMGLPQLILALVSLVFWVFIFVYSEIFSSINALSGQNPIFFIFVWLLSRITFFILVVLGFVLLEGIVIGKGLYIGQAPDKAISYDNEEEEPEVVYKNSWRYVVVTWVFWLAVILVIPEIAFRVMQWILN